MSEISPGNWEQRHGIYTARNAGVQWVFLVLALSPTSCEWALWSPIILSSLGLLTYTMKGFDYVTSSVSFNLEKKATMGDN